MKVALLGDLHWGARNDSEFFHRQFNDFVDEVLIPACLKHGVSQILQLGDMMDKRKTVNFMTLKMVKDAFARLDSNRIHMTALVGNHDVFHKNTVEVNSLQLLFSDVPNFTPIVHPTMWGGLMIVPWICDENRSEVMSQIASSQAKYLAGHFELAGFDMYRGVPCEHGDDHTAFSKFRKVYSGHFHTRSIKDNVEYVGTPYEIIWSDHGDEKGFLILDTETGEEIWIRNDRKIHLMIRYREYEIQKTYDFSVVKDRYVKIVVEKAENQKKLDAFVKMCYSNEPVHLALIDLRAEEEEEDLSGEIVADKDPLTVLTDEIRRKNEEQKAMSLVKKSNELYIEAMTEREQIA